MTPNFTRILIISLYFMGLSSAVGAQSSDDDLVEQGEYTARAADCMSCHIGPDGTPYAGGKFIETPLGAIMATNISPSNKYGIGQYSEKDLTDALRKGKAPGRMLYPAMPYPSYHGMKDEDIHALHAFLKTVEPVESAPGGETDLDFPFNMRFLMRVWDVIALGDNVRTDHADDEIARGAYLVDHLGHCGTCHTPRDSLMMSDDTRYLGGAIVQGWEAPNITSDPTSGLGNWQVEDIVEYLKIGRAMNSAQAAGPMAEVVHFSTRHLKDDDLTAMARYLKTVPALKSEGQTNPVTLPVAERQAIPAPSYGSIRDELGAALVKTDLAADKMLYLTQCAACHGVNGEGQPQAYYPALNGNGDIRRDNAVNLVNVIAEGVSHSTLYRAPTMPGFARDLSSAQIADLANYVRVEFGGFDESTLTESDINAILEPDPDLPFLIKYAAVLAWLGIIVALVIAGGVIWLVWRRRRKPIEEKV